ncbi:hypothetical protein, partial [Stenotrophomonas maltophilia]
SDSPYLNPALERLNFIPSPMALSETPPVLAYHGGDIGITAGRDVLGTRDVWSERVLGLANGTSLDPTIGQSSQRWRVVSGEIGVDT